MPYYTVAKTKDGKGTGIYPDWESAKQFCIASKDDRPLPEAKFKKFDLYEAAFEYWKQMKSPSVFAYFQSSDGMGGVFDCFESMVTSLGTRWNSYSESIDFVQRSSKGEAEQWLKERRLANKTLTKAERKGKKRESDETLTSMSGLSKRPCLCRTDGEQENGLCSPSALNIVSDENSTKAKRHSDVYKERPDVILVSTDGACINNGQKNKAVGGYGVWFGEDDPRNEHGPLPPNSKFSHTNQRAELYAIKRALEITRNDPRAILIRTDSKYSMQCVTEWLPNWRKNGFVTSNKTPVKNRDLIEPIDLIIRERGEKNVEFQYVPGHSGDTGNEAADRLASRGASEVNRYRSK